MATASHASSHHLEQTDIELKQVSKNDKESQKQHDNAFKEKLQAGIIEKFTEEGEVGQTHYLPHHLVIRNDKAPTKLTVVFNAFAASKGPSFLKKNEVFVEKINYNSLQGCS